MPYKTFGFTSEQILMRDNVLKLLARVMPADKIEEHERNDAYPEVAFQALAKEGYLALPFEETLAALKPATRTSPSSSRRPLITIPASPRRS